MSPLDSSQTLPVDEIVVDLTRALQVSGTAILQAPPGSGKTTRVPLALLGADWLKGRKILMLEPRRLAATNAARYMATLLGETAGETVGYTIRYERRGSSATRIEVITEGLLTRRLQSDPELRDIGLVIFDEFHERSLHADLALALCRDIQQGLRDDLRLLVMSATLDAAPLASLLGDCPVLSASGRACPVDIIHAEQDAQRPLADQVAACVRRALQETREDILVFLPGAAEIRRCHQRLADLAGDVSLHRLHGSLPFAEQEAAIMPGPRRKVVLATNIAETSLTIEGIGTVVDSGWERRPGFDAGRGMFSLDTVRISRASAEQRAGRAGRLGPGRCYRLWSEGSHGALLPFSPPEILSADLAPLAFELVQWGIEDPAQLCWLDPPPAGHIAAARRLLLQLGAIDQGGQLTAIGRQMSRSPAHPRIARLLVEAVEAGCPGLGADLAALISEYRPGGKAQDLVSDSDLLDRFSRLHHGTGHDLVAARRASRFWRKRLGCHEDTAPDRTLIGRLLLVAFPDQLARQREPGSDCYLLRSGRGAILSRHTAVRDVEWLVAFDMETRRDGENLILQASALDQATIEAEFDRQVSWQREIDWDDSFERLRAREVRRLGAIILQERPVLTEPSELVSAMLKLVRRLGLEVLPWSDAARQLRARAALLHRQCPDVAWPDWSDAALMEDLEGWLAPGLEGMTKKADLSRLDLVSLLKNRLGWQRLPDLDRLTPERLEVPSGSKIRLDYCQGERPVLAVKLQEMFGLVKTPTVVGGRLPVLVHLLSPAGRPLAVTQDLENFWREIYPEVRNEMKGRYPKHPWPDDPMEAEATRRVKPRKG